MLGPYQLVEAIGRGGMGEVWSARDTRLDRLVALKFASSDFSERFAREARLIAALNHPNICTLHDVGPNFLVMELIEGRQLDRLIPKSGLRLNEALHYAVDIADAVAAAHARGIVHRDLKPGNVMITPKGRVKVLDFGLAKLAALAKGDEGENATNIETSVSGEDTIVGTTAYMSPEQAQGLPVDARSDIFSFGVLLYEMLTGVRPFSGDTKAATLAALINEEPRPARELASIPAELDRLLTRSLRKDPNRRPQTMADLHVALLELKEESDSGRLSSTSGISAAAERSKWNAWRWVAGSAALLLVAGATWWVARRESPAQPQARTITVTNYAGRQGQPALSPDGTQLAFVWDGDRNGNQDVYVKAIGEADALRLTNDPASDLWPTWSPDGKRLAFRRGDSVYTRAVLGGSERRIGTGLSMPNALGTGQMSWSPDGRWIAVPTTTGLFLLPAEGGELRAATTAGGAGALDRSAAFSPDGRTLAFFRCEPDVSCRVFLQSLSASGTPEGPPRQRFKQPFRSGGVAWSRDGERLIFSGSPTASGLGSIWQVGVRTEDPPERLPLAGEVTLAGISAAGERLAFVRVLTGAQVWKVVNGRAEPFIRSAGQIFDFAAAFSPDGRTIAFQSGRLGKGDHIFAANADGSGVVQLTGSDVTYAATPDWSPDGKWLTFSTQRDDGGFDIAVMESSGGPARPLTAGNDNERPVFSHDGRRVWFTSTRTGRSEIWSVAFEGGPETQFTSEGRMTARVSTDGRTVYYQDFSGNLYARQLAGGPERRIATDLAGRYAFTVVRDGIYLVRADKQGSNGVLYFADLAGQSGRVVSDLPGYWAGGPSVSPDQRTILYSHYIPNSVVEVMEGIR
jgi:Tol biopolymer transport system component/predicted Ser/Thr protein kinase